MTQGQLAERLGISASYLNLIEHNHRQLPAPMLIKIAHLFQVDLQTFGPEESERLHSELLEVFGDSLFDGDELQSADMRELANTSPHVARAVVKLYQAYHGASESAHSLASQLSASDEPQSALGGNNRLPSEEINDLIQRHGNYFPELEEGAEKLRHDGRLDGDDLFWALVHYLETAHDVHVKVERVQMMGGAVRRYDPSRRMLYLSEVLRRGSRNFQLAHQIGLLTQHDIFDRIIGAQSLSSDESRALCRVMLANYFSSAVLMPYHTFLAAARQERYDIELLGHRFRTSFEQVCHRLTSMRRPGAEGVPFHLVRVDIAGNISKRFSGSGIRFARFSAACPRWNVHQAFLTPGRICVQLSRMPDGTTYFDIARTLRKASGGFHAPHAVQAIGIGCEVHFARELVYSDGINLDANTRTAVPVGVTCRMCERTDCEQRAMPSLFHAMPLDENVRGVSFYAPVK